MSDNSDDFVPCDFVYTGRRALTDHTYRVTIRKITADGALGEEMQYRDDKDFNRFVVGGVYHGASFRAGTIKGYATAYFQGLWKAADLRMEWQARESAARDQVRAAKLENNFRKMSEIEELLMPLRKRYAALQKLYDRAGCYALERAVVRALLTPLRKVEKEKVDDE